MTTRPHEYLFIGFQKFVYTHTRALRFGIPVLHTKGGGGDKSQTTASSN